MSSSPFSNGTEADAWMSLWCRWCDNDHVMHRDLVGPGCDIIAEAYMHSDRHPKEWRPEPPGKFYMPPLIICTKFTPCKTCGDDRAEERVELVAISDAEWAKSRETT